MADDTEQLADALRALADPARLQLLRLILRERSGLDPRCTLHGGVCFCHLSEAVDLAPATVSHHLKLLRRAGFIEGVRAGRWTYYRVREPKVSNFMHSLAGWLDYAEPVGSAEVGISQSTCAKRASERR